MNKVYAAVPISNIFSPATTFPTIGSLVNVLTQNAMFLAGILAFVFIIIAGFGIILGGGGDPKKMEQAKTTFTMAIAGLLVIVLAFWIIQLIKIVLGFDPLQLQTTK